MEKIYRVQMNKHGMPNFATAEEVADKPKGEWIDNGDRYFRCSLCGTKDTDKWHWCHGCGAQMKGADDE